MTDICKTVYPSYDGAGYNDNEVNFVLDTNALLDFHSWLKQHSADRHVALRGHITMIPSQSVFVISP